MRTATEFGVEAFGCDGRPRRMCTVARAPHCGLVSAMRRQGATENDAKENILALGSSSFLQHRQHPTDADDRRPTTTTTNPAQVSIAIAGHDDLDRRRHDDHGRLLFLPTSTLRRTLVCPPARLLRDSRCTLLGGFVDLTRSARIASLPTTNPQRRTRNP